MFFATVHANIDLFHWEPSRGSPMITAKCFIATEIANDKDCNQSGDRLATLG